MLAGLRDTAGGAGLGIAEPVGHRDHRPQPAVGGEHRVEHADVDVLAGTGAVAQPERGEDRDGAVQPGQ